MTNRVIDGRARGWLWLDNAVIDEYAAVIGPYALAVYTALCRHADANGQAFPSIATLAQKLGMSPNTVRKAIGTLVEQRLVTCEPRQDEQGDALSNLYALQAVGGTAPHEVPHAMQEGTAPREVRVLHDVKGNKTQLNKTHGTRVAPGGAPPKPDPKKPSSSEKPNQTPPGSEPPPTPAALPARPAVKDIYGRYSRAAVPMAAAGITPEQVAAFTAHLRCDRFWKNKLIPLTYIAENIGVWLAEQRGKEHEIQPATTPVAKPSRPGRPIPYQ